MGLVNHLGRQLPDSDAPPGAEVQHLTAGGFGIEQCEVRRDDIVDVGGVPRLLAVAVGNWRFASETLPGEMRIGHVGPHRGGVPRNIPEIKGRKVRHPMPDVTVVLGGKFSDRIPAPGRGESTSS